MTTSDISCAPQAIWDAFDAPEDPYPSYRELRDNAPVYYNSVRNYWVISRYADVRAANRDWRTYSYERGVDIDGCGDFLQPGHFLHEDPPLHTALRSVVQDSFTPSAISELTRVIEREATTLVEVVEVVEVVEECDEFDFAAECAWVLPVRVASYLLGFPLEDCELLRRLSDDAFIDVPGPIGSAAAGAAGRAAAAVRHYFEKQIETRRRQPQDDLLTRIATAQIDGSPIGDSAAGVASAVFGGAVDTTALTLTSAVSLLAEHDEQRARLASHPEAMGWAVEEVLRHEGPIQVFRRTTTRAVDLHEVSIPRGSSGVAVVLSCSEGTCGTCETAVLAGEVDHRDSILYADEQAANDCMFICVSRARSDRLVLDL